VLLECLVADEYPVAEGISGTDGSPSVDRSEVLGQCANVTESM